MIVFNIDPQIRCESIQKCVFWFKYKTPLFPWARNFTLIA